MSDWDWLKPTVQVMDSLFHARLHFANPSSNKNGKPDGELKFARLVELTPKQIDILRALAETECRLKRMELAGALESRTGEVVSEATTRIEAARLVEYGLIDNVKPHGYAITDKGRVRLKGQSL